tara:strand:- start:75 stop:341 length:267 start_codon:yes stop_codon:yes gene_type:complete
MYSYYLQRVLTRETPKYKKLVTLLQLVQFSTSFVLFIFSTKFHFGGGGCSGYTSLVFTILFNLTLMNFSLWCATEPEKPKQNLKAGFA